MRFPQVVVYESDGRLAALLRPLAERQVWALREPRQIESCLRLLPGGEPSVIVIKLGHDLEREFALLQRARLLAPTTAAVLVADTDHPRLVGLGWDLGAAMVLAPPRPREALLQVVAALMDEPALPGEARMIELPQVDETRCTGCGDCVLVCPTDCLAMVGPLPHLKRPDHCTSCSLCVLICPEQALRMAEPLPA